MSKIFGKDFESMAQVVSAMDGVRITEKRDDYLFLDMTNSCIEDFESKLEKSSFKQIEHHPQSCFISQKQQVEVFIAAHHTAVYDEKTDAWYRSIEIYQLGD